MSVSQAVFVDVAPAIYSKTCFRTYTKLDSGTIADYFEGHVRLTYGPRQPPWISLDARRLLKHIAVDISLSNLDYPSQLEVPFRNYFATVHHFPSLETLNINIHDRYKMQERFSDFPDLDDSEAGLLSLTRRILSRHLADELKRVLPKSCDLKIFVRETLVSGDGPSIHLGPVLE